VALAGVAFCFVFGEWQILTPFSRFLSTSAGSMDKAASNYLPSNILKTVSSVMDNNNDVDEGDDDEVVSHDEVSITTKKPKITKLVLIGERHSGTTYATQILAKCFPNLHVTDYFVRYKHWFQPTPDQVVNVTRTFLQDFSKQELKRRHLPFEWPDITKNPKTYFEDTLVVLMVRNPYDWLEAIREGPHHWPNHMGFYKFPTVPRKINMAMEGFTNMELRLKTGANSFKPTCLSPRILEMPRNFVKQDTDTIKCLRVTSPKNCIPTTYSKIMQTTLLRHPTI
jgi:hypothetical protein